MEFRYIQVAGYTLNLLLELGASRTQPPIELSPTGTEHRQTLKRAKLFTSCGNAYANCFIKATKN